MEFRVLGPVEIGIGGKPVTIREPSTRTVLSILLMEAGKLVSVDDLVDELWPDDPPRDARVLAQGYVSRLRRAVRAAGHTSIEPMLRTHGPGYVLTMERDHFDVHRFEALVARARHERSERRYTASAEYFRKADTQWRGEPFAHARETLALATESMRLRELRLLALEELYEVELALGNDSRLIPELSRAVLQHPYRSRFTAQLMLALHQTGRTPEALDIYARAVDRLRTELGLDPPVVLQRLHLAILRNDADILVVTRDAMDRSSKVTEAQEGPARQVSAPVLSARPSWHFASVYCISRDPLLSRPVLTVHRSVVVKRRLQVDAGTYDFWQLMGEATDLVGESFEMTEGHYRWTERLHPDASGRYRQVSILRSEDSAGPTHSWTGWWGLGGTGEHTWGGRIRRRS